MKIFLNLAFSFATFVVFRYDMTVGHFQSENILLEPAVNATLLTFSSSILLSFLWIAVEPKFEKSKREILKNGNPIATCLLKECLFVQTLVLGVFSNVHQISILSSYRCWFFYWYGWTVNCWCVGSWTEFYYIQNLRLFTYGIFARTASGAVELESFDLIVVKCRKVWTIITLHKAIQAQAVLSLAWLYRYAAPASGQGDRVMCIPVASHDNLSKPGGAHELRTFIVPTSHGVDPTHQMSFFGSTAW